MHAASHCSPHHASLNQLHFAAYQGTPSASKHETHRILRVRSKRNALTKMSLERRRDNRSSARAGSLKTPMSEETTLDRAYSTSSATMLPCADDDLPFKENI
jgi:hypothetical protein